MNRFYHTDLTHCQYHRGAEHLKLPGIDFAPKRCGRMGSETLIATHWLAGKVQQQGAQRIVSCSPCRSVEVS